MSATTAVVGAVENYERIPKGHQTGSMSTNSVRVSSHFTDEKDGEGDDDEGYEERHEGLGDDGVRGEAKQSGHVAGGASGVRVQAEGVALVAGRADDRLLQGRRGR